MDCILNSTPYIWEWCGKKFSGFSWRNWCKLQPAWRLSKAIFHPGISKCETVRANQTTWRSGHTLIWDFSNKSEQNKKFSIQHSTARLTQCVCETYRKINLSEGIYRLFATDCHFTAHDTNLNTEQWSCDCRQTSVRQQTDMRVCHDALQPKMSSAVGVPQREQ